MFTQTEIPLAQDTFFGPARIVEIDGKRVQVETPDAFPWARVAVVHCYRPTVGDQVVVAGRGEEWFVIGVLDAKGPTVFTAPGDMEFHAPRGNMKFQASERLQLRARMLDLMGETVEVAAKTLVQTAQEILTWARKGLRLRSESMRTDVEKLSHHKAGEIVQDAKGDARINAKTIHLC